MWHLFTSPSRIMTHWSHILDVVIVRDNRVHMHTACTIKCLRPVLMRYTLHSSRGPSGCAICVNASMVAGWGKQQHFADCVRYVFWRCDSYCIDVSFSRRWTCWGMVEACDTGLCRIVDHYAPLVVKTVTLRPDMPRYTGEPRREKFNRQWTWLCTGLVVHRAQWLRGRTLDTRLRVRIQCCGIKTLGKCFILHWCSSLSWMLPGELWAILRIGPCAIQEFTF